MVNKIWSKPTLGIEAPHSWSRYSHGFANQRRQALDLVAMHAGWAVEHVHSYLLLSVWPAEWKRRNVWLKLRHLRRGRKEYFVIKWINTSIYWIIIIGLIHFCCSECSICFLSTEALAGVQNVRLLFSIFVCFLSSHNRNTKKFPLIYFEVPGKIP